MATNKVLRHITAVRSLRLLARGQVISRADIARELGLTRATVGYAIAELTESGLIREAEGAIAGARKGRPSIGVEINPAGAYFLGVDIGSRVLTAVLVDLAMSVIARRAVPIGPDYRDPAKITPRLLPLAESVLTDAGIAPDLVNGIGVSVPGLVGRDGSVVHAPYLGWTGFPLREAIRASAPPGWSVDIVNDAFGFAVAERAVRPDEEADDLFLMLLAEGIGGATIDDGRVFSGARGFAGEIGHTLIGVKGRNEPFENLAGARIFSHLTAPGLSIAESAASLIARQDEADVAHALDTWADAVATGLANVVHLLDPARVILGGPVAALYPLRAERIADRLTAMLLKGFVAPDISVARFGADGAAIGAAATVREHVFALPELGS